VEFHDVKLPKDIHQGDEIPDHVKVSRYGIRLLVSDLAINDVHLRSTVPRPLQGPTFLSMNSKSAQSAPV